MGTSNLRYMWILRYENDHLDYYRMVGIFPYFNNALDYVRNELTVNIDSSRYPAWLRKKGRNIRGTEPYPTTKDFEDYVEERNKEINEDIINFEEMVHNDYEKAVEELGFAQELEIEKIFQWGHDRYIFTIAKVF